MRTTIVGEYEDFAAASRAAASLMIAGFPQARIGVVGRNVAFNGDAEGRAQFAFAGAIARELTGAVEDDFDERLVCALSRLCVPPAESSRHARALEGGGGLLVLQVPAEDARRAEAIMREHGTAMTYAVGPLPLTRGARTCDELRIRVA
ncbi:MAG: hypothetical protein U1F41_14850 [Burkholderiales bacterium]